MKRYTIPLFGALLCCTFLLSCNSNKAVDNYSIKVCVPQSETQGTVAYLVDYDNDTLIDSTVVESDTIKFSGICDKPAIVRVNFANSRRMFIIEPGDIIVDSNGVASGTSLNEHFERFGESLNKIESADNDSTLALLQNLCEKEISSDTPVGYYALLQLGYYINIAQIDSLLSQHTYYADFNRIQRLRKAKVQEAATAPGCQYVDFSITDSTDSTSVRLSDYVVKGQYTIVDFWASWCRYCIMEIPSLKSLLNQYGDKGLNIVGVAVWDKKDASKSSLEKHDVTWPQILDAQNIPTDLYGVTGIPQIFIIGPDGKIVARNLQGARLINTVDSLMSNFSIENE